MVTSHTGDAEFVSLPADEALPASALGRVTTGDPSTVILLAGPIGSGKTTIIVSLFELFNQGPVAGLLFAGSSTLAGFERICHPGRAVAGLPSADTIRTNPHAGAAFLHLRVADVTAESPRLASVLVSDVTGEAFEEARDFAEPAKLARPLWRRADLICLVLDGERISNVQKRSLVRTEALGLLRAARDSKLLPERCRLSVVTTKWDVVEATDAQSFVDSTENLIADRHGHDFASVSNHRIAARPVSTRVPYAFGVPRLLTDWMALPTAKPALSRPPPAPSGLGSFASAFWTGRSGLLKEVFNAR